MVRLVFLQSVKINKDIWCTHEAVLVQESNRCDKIMSLRVSTTYLPSYAITTQYLPLPYTYTDLSAERIKVWECPHDT